MLKCSFQELSSDTKLFRALTLNAGILPASYLILSTLFLESLEDTMISTEVKLLYELTFV